MRMFIALVVVALATPFLFKRPDGLADPEAFRVALEENDVARLREVLDGGFDVNAPQLLGLSPLMLSARMSRPEVTAMLIRRGARVNARCPRDLTALSYAAYTGDEPTLELLLRAGAEPNTSDVAGGTPLMWAVRSRSLAKVRMLLAAGADLRARTRVGDSALDFAREYDVPEIAACLEVAARERQAKSPKAR
jgi:ankyrin repeat protein